MDEPRASLSDLKQQLSSKQQLSELHLQQLQERLYKHEEAAKSTLKAGSLETARLQKQLDDCLAEARQKAEDIQTSLEHDIGVRIDSNDDLTLIISGAGAEPSQCNLTQSWK